MKPYYTGLTPKRGFTILFRELDTEIKQLNYELNMFIIRDDQVEVARVRKEIAGKMVYIQSMSKGI